MADATRTSNIELGYVDNARKLLNRHRLTAYVKPRAEQLTQARLSGDQRVVCVNQIACNEARAIVQLPAATTVWDIADIGEGSRIATTDAERKTYEEEVFTEVTAKVDELVAELHLG